jgi:arylsulfatase A-like enzyme
MPSKSKPAPPPRPNILLITCDQYRFPRFSYGPDGGFAEPLKQILGFQGEVDDSNPYAKFFPGLLKLRKNAVVLRNHTIAASACTPSRAVIYTGQYGTRTGVTQTDGLFKNGDAPNFPWLDADGIPTLGTWMREAGYSTHYFGKWHVSNPPEHSLKRYGFDDWESSYPEPHGSQANNLGVYRDVGFTDSACAFIRRQGIANNYNRVYASMLESDPNASAPDASAIPPWFAVASFTNPHDIATYPGAISQALPTPDDSGTQKPFGPLTIPLEGQVTPPPTAGTIQIPLNPDAFPQDCANPSPTQGEKLETKPSCQHEYAYKMGLALSSKLGFNLAERLPGHDDKRKLDIAVDVTLQACIPFQLSGDPGPDENATLFLQLYAWLHAVVDPHVDAVLTALEESGQAENTIVIFLADHGEYGAAHGMMIEKWHTAYQEALHVPVVFVNNGLNADAATPIQCDALTSHVDILPTVLGLAHVGPLERDRIAQKLMQSRPVPPLPGIDLAPLVRGEWRTDEVREADGSKREGVLFITDDEITAPLAFENDSFGRRSYAEFEVYRATVQAVRKGHKGKGPVDLAPGSVKQPNHVRCVRTMEYKLARYFDPSGAVPDEWEMYDLAHDPNERVSLVQTDVSPPTVHPNLPNATALQSTATQLADLLKRLERRYL